MLSIGAGPPSRWSPYGAGVRELTQGQGADRVVDVAGLLGESLKAVKVAGHIACVGFVSETAPPIDPWVLFGSGATVRALAVGSRAQFVAMNRLIEQKRIRPVIDRVFPFDQAPEAFRYYASGAAFGKVVISHRADATRPESAGA